MEQKIKKLERKVHSLQIKLEEREENAIKQSVQSFPFPVTHESEDEYEEEEEEEEEKEEKEKDELFLKMSQMFLDRHDQYPDLIYLTRDEFLLLCDEVEEGIMSTTCLNLCLSLFC